MTRQSVTTTMKPPVYSQLAKSGSFFLALFLLVCLSELRGRSSSGAPKTEVRAVWMHPDQQFASDPVKGKQEVRQFVNRIADANFNMILPWVTSEYLAAL